MNIYIVVVRNISTVQNICKSPVFTLLFNSNQHVTKVVINFINFWQSLICFSKYIASLFLITEASVTPSSPFPQKILPKMSFLVNLVLQPLFPERMVDKISQWGCIPFPPFNTFKPHPLRPLVKTFYQKGYFSPIWYCNPNFRTGCQWWKKGALVSPHPPPFNIFFRFVYETSLRVRSTPGKRVGKRRFHMAISDEPDERAITLIPYKFANYPKK